MLWEIEPQKDYEDIKGNDEKCKSDNPWYSAPDFTGFINVDEEINGEKVKKDYFVCSYYRFFDKPKKETETTLNY